MIQDLRGVQHAELEIEVPIQTRSRIREENVLILWEGKSKGIGLRGKPNTVFHGKTVRPR